MSQKTHFRPDIEGLRALSVLCVVAFHAFERFLPGGFVGVDVFFVISGFVITQSLLVEYERNSKIDLWGFWTRRVKRILPASSLVLLTIAIIALFDPDLDSRAVGKDIISAALFVLNYRFALQSNEYLATDHSNDPLLHFWSLSAEEQFYLFWPALLICALYLGRRNLSTQTKIIVVFALCIIVTSFAYSAYLVRINPSFAFFDTTSRTWQFLSGALIAVLSKKVKLPTLMMHILGIIGIGAILSFSAFYSSHTPYPGAWALVPTFGACALIISGIDHKSISAQFLSNKFLRYIGRISFAWYLWHWPFLVFGNSWFGPSTTIVFLLIAGSFATAILTHHYLEDPIRYSKDFLRTKATATLFGVVLISLTASSGVILRFISISHIALGNGQFISQDTIKRDAPSIYKDHCLRRTLDALDKNCSYGPMEGPSVLLLGDSHAGNWFEPLRAAAKIEGWRVIVRIKAACRPTNDAQEVEVGGLMRPYTECAQWLSDVKSELASNKPNLIIVGSSSLPSNSTGEEDFIRYLASFAPTILIRGTPVFPRTTLDCLKNKALEECKWRLEAVQPKGLFPIIPKDALPSGTSILDMNEHICPGQWCAPVVNGKVVMFDNHHLSQSFSLTLTPIFQRLLEQQKAF